MTGGSHAPTVACFRAPSRGRTSRPAAQYARTGGALFPRLTSSLVGHRAPISRTLASYTQDYKGEVAAPTCEGSSTSLVVNVAASICPVSASTAMTSDSDG